MIAPPKRRLVASSDGERINDLVLCLRAIRDLCDINMGSYTPAQPRRILPRVIKLCERALEADGRAVISMQRAGGRPPPPSAESEGGPSTD